MFRRIAKKIKYFLSNESCYDDMVLRGIAKDGKCKGIAGGSWETGFLSEGCVTCPYMIKK